MNERIQELAEQAWNDTAVSPDFGHPVLFAEKFAELIVRECISKIEEAAEYSPELYGVALDIQEHFGVE